MIRLVTIDDLYEMASKVERWAVDLESSSDITPEHVRSYIDRVFESVEGVVAEIDGEMVGACVFMMSDSLFNTATNAYMQVLYVEPKHRSTALAVGLLDSAYWTAKNAGCKTFYAGHESAHRPNSLNKLFTYAGFKQIGSSFMKE